MRVLHVHSGNLYGGVETLLVTLARNRHLTPDMEPHFAIAFPGRLLEGLSATGAAVHRIGEVRVRRPLAVLRARRALARILEEIQPDVVLFHSAWAQAIFAPVVSRAGRPFAVWKHDLTTGRHWLERWSSRSEPAGVITSSHFIARSISDRESGMPAVVHCPVEKPDPVQTREVVRGELATPAAHTVLVQLGRFEEWKGHRILLEALSMINDIEGWTCWLVGGAQRPQEAEYLQSLQRYAAALGLGERVRFTGQRGDVGSILAAADILCQPNTRPEPFGIAMVEAMFHGLPVVASAAGGALEIVDPQCGVLVPPSSPSAFARALRVLILDPGVRRYAGQRSAERAVALCGLQPQMRELERVLLKAVR